MTDQKGTELVIGILAEQALNQARARFASSESVVAAEPVLELESLLAQRQNKGQAHRL